jgi:hypothetical protein
MKNWIIDLGYDIKWWYKDRPFKKMYRSIADRVNAFFFCLMLMIVGIWKPRMLRNLMVDSLKDNK